MSLDPAKRVTATPTPWGTPWDHHSICVNMDGILRSCGVTAAHVRRRMIAHAIVASGWRQNVWCYNAWGVKTGSSWAGAWYTMTTQEDDGTGTMYTVYDDKWRAFPGWKACVVDFQGRIAAASSRYGASYAALIDEARLDSEYWRELGIAGYYTDTTNMHPDDFASVCQRVYSELVSATPAEFAAAMEIPVGSSGAGEAGGVVGSALALLAIAAVVVLLALALRG